jgi:hypothetical protein
MLSSVLRSKRAVQVNVEITRAFVKLREMLASHKDLARKLETLERPHRVLVLPPGHEHDHEHESLA